MKKHFFLSDFKIIHRDNSGYSECNKCQIWEQSDGGTCVLQVTQSEVPGKSDLKVTGVTLLGNAMDD